MPYRSEEIDWTVLVTAVGVLITGYAALAILPSKGDIINLESKMDKMESKLESKLESKMDKLESKLDKDMTELKSKLDKYIIVDHCAIATMERLEIEVDSQLVRPRRHTK